MIISTDTALGSGFSTPSYARPRFSADAPPSIIGNPHFIGRYSQAAFQRPRFNTTALDLPPVFVEANPHFVGRYSQPQLRRPLFNAVALDVMAWTPPPPPPLPQTIFLQFAADFPEDEVSATCPPAPATPLSFSDALTAPTGDALLPTIIAQTPRGAAWRTDEVQDSGDSSFQHRFWRAVADPIAALYAKAWKLAFASTACTLSGPEDQLNDSLEDWESERGLPDPCTASIIFSVATRKLILRQKVVGAEIVQWGGQSAQYFICLAKTRGYTIAVNEYRPLRCGQGRCGRTEIGGPVNEVFWQVFVATPTIKYFHCGDRATGMCGRDPLGSFGRKLDLECELNTWKPAHTKIRYHYIYVPSGTAFDLQQAVAAIERAGTGFLPARILRLTDDSGNPLIDEAGNVLME